MGQAALVLAARLDAGSDSAAGVSSVAKELRATLEDALRGSKATADPLDEIAARRRAKASA